MKLDILAISAHPDDVEVAAGGTLLHHVALGKKFEAIRAYKSQFYQPDCTDPETPISCPSFFEALRGRNAMLGRQIGVEYAEAFSVVGVVGVRDLFDLI